MPKAKAPVTKKVGTEKTLEEMVKVWSAIQTKIDAANLVLKNLNAEFDAQERRIFEAMQAQGLSNIGTGKATAYISNKTFVSIDKEDGFDKFIAFVFKHKAVDLLHRRVNQKSFLERTENGELVPGIVRVDIPQVHLRRK